MRYLSIASQQCILVVEEVAYLLNNKPFVDSLSSPLLLCRALSRSFEGAIFWAVIFAKAIYGVVIFVRVLLVANVIWLKCLLLSCLCRSEEKEQNSTLFLSVVRTERI